MKAFKIYAVFVTVILAITIACGGGSTSTSAVSNKIAGAFGGHGFGGLSKESAKVSAKSGMHFNLIDTANAQSAATISMSGTYHGSCQQAAQWTVDNYTPMDGTGVVDGMACNPTLNNTTWNATALAAAQQSSGEPAIGAGTLSQLVVYGTGAGTVEVYVNRAGTVIDTGVGCALVGTVLNRCYDTTHTFAVADGDMVMYIFGYTAGTSPTNITAYISKA